jgi:hypothetical protein
LSAGTWKDPALTRPKAVSVIGAERFLSWILLLRIGITGLWAGAFHVFFPATAAKLIGWEVSPFQFEVGMADLAIGATACVAYWCDLASRRRP